MLVSYHIFILVGFIMGYQLYAVTFNSETSWTLSIVFTTRDIGRIGIGEKRKFMPYMFTTVLEEINFISIFRNELHSL